MVSSSVSGAHEFMGWSWAHIEPYFKDLQERELTRANIQSWMADWAHLAQMLTERRWRGYAATTVSTTDTRARERYSTFLDQVYPQTLAAEQKLKEKLLASGCEPSGYEQTLRNFRAEADLYREANLPLLGEDLKLNLEYDEVIGAQTVSWGGEELTVSQLAPVFLDADRQRRERAWRLGAERQLADREAINALWQKHLALRQRLAANAGRSDYRAYRWQFLLRFDYSPQDCFRFHQAIEQVVVPAARRVNERRRQRLEVAELRPWDLNVDPFGRPPLHPFDHVAELEEKAAGIFRLVDPQLGEYFEIMRREGLLDLDNRKGKAPGGYCVDFPATGRPFIFANAVGIHDDVQTILHEGGHAFHAFECFKLPFFLYRNIPMEFNEVASMAMELLAAPYLSDQRVGFYLPADAARARVEKLENDLLFWPYMAVVDAFQHWVYENPVAALQPASCDAAWDELWQRFMPGVDWSGLEQIRMTGWQRKSHIHEEPFYYVEYGLAQLGAAQVWRNALHDQAGAVAAYRKALGLGGSVPLPQLYMAAGARFSFDADMLAGIVDLYEQTIQSLDQ